MFRLLIVSCVLVAIHGAAVPPLRRHQHMKNIFPNGKIVGGSKVSIDQVPWQVALQDTGYLFCGGSIISANYILTAAHCTDGALIKYLSVRSGTDKLENGGVVTEVESIAQNSKYDFVNLDYDISILKLAKPLNLSTENRQLAIVLRSAEAKDGETAQVSGWGALNEDDFDLPVQLQAVQVPVVSRKDCNEDYDGKITDRMICAGETGKDSCQGDSGGAITIDNQQVGIVSWGYGCAEEGFPGVYSNLAALQDFVNENSNNEAQWA